MVPLEAEDPEQNQGLGLGSVYGFFNWHRRIRVVSQQLQPQEGVAGPGWKVRVVGTTIKPTDPSWCIERQHKVNWRLEDEWDVSWFLVYKCEMSADFIFSVSNRFLVDQLFLYCLTLKQVCTLYKVSTVSLIHEVDISELTWKTSWGWAEHQSSTQLWV